MKYALIAASLLSLAVTPAFAGNKGGGSLIGSVLAPVTTAVSVLNVSALNGASVLNGTSVNVLNGNKTVVTAPVLIKGLLGGGGHGCGCN